ncbi:Alpha/Beta hydrolase protein [Mycena capillaripes]|nr:Alpha/Beta hydrolase protein [Mycena capillaripes]
MKIFSLACLFLALFLSTSFASPLLTSRAISTALYDEFVLYTKYSSAAYQLFCPKPVGKTLVKSFEFGRTQGFIARDNERQEIVVSFRGTFSLKDAVTDAKFLLVPFESPGIVELVHVHRGFLAAYADVAEDVVSIVKAELKQYPTFRIVVTGHSLGGAIASLAAPSIKAALPQAPLALYTFGLSFSSSSELPFSFLNGSDLGQPRAGNAKFARYVEKMIGEDNIFRGMFPAWTTDHGVPTMVPRFFGYEHFATEYWQFKDPIPLIAPAHATVKKCVGNEDPTCSASIISTGINPFHTFYFGQVMAVNPLLCF